MQDLSIVHSVVFFALSGRIIQRQKEQIRTLSVQSFKNYPLNIKKLPNKLYDSSHGRRTIWQKDPQIVWNFSKVNIFAWFFYTSEAYGKFQIYTQTSNHMYSSRLCDNSDQRRIRTENQIRTKEKFGPNFGIQPKLFR